MDEPQDLSLLTARQREVWDLRHGSDPPMIFREIGEKVGLSTGSTWQLYRRAADVLKTGIPSEEAQRRGRSRGAKATSYARREENVNPEFGAKVMDQLSNPLNENVAELARDLGLSQPLARQIQLRLERDYLPLSRQLGTVRANELKDLFGLCAYEILVQISKEDIANASLRDKLVAAGIATDKHQLLSGLPTEIFSVQQLENLDKLALQLLKEAKRRGQMEIIDPDTQEVALLPEPQQP